MAGGLGWVLSRGAADERGALPVGEVSLWDLRRADVVQVSWPVDGAPCVLIRAGDRWSLPEGPPLAPERVDDLLDAIEAARRGVPVGAIDAASVGLSPGVRLEVRSATGDVFTAEVGDDAPVGGRTYVRASDGAVLAVGGGLREALRTGCPR